MNQREVNLVFSSGKYFKNKLFSGKYKKSNTFKLAVAPSKKIFKTAVSRNKIKRKVFSVARGLPTLPRFHFVVIPEKTITQADFTEIKSGVIELIYSLK